MKIGTKRLYDKRAPIYDLTHHLQTLWADDRHRAEVVNSINPPEKGVILDVATGTALTAIKAAIKYTDSSIIGVDYSEKMLEQAKIKVQREGLENRIQLMCADILNLPFDSSYFDCVISAYGLGGIQNIDLALEEIKRVGKPNGEIVFAEMSETPKEYAVKRKIHEYVVEPWIKFWWNFRDLNLPALLESHGIIVKDQKFFNDYSLGSTTLVRGTITK
ncbi:class I SAM-dependent methyltransferase [Candidatus Woesearchaeota archaeon]|nr:class I SAM-dependent methyltransferase [Candidatus Woesearchaeota archaeon]